MDIFLYIVLFLLAFLIFVLSTKIYVVFYFDGNVRITFKILFYKRIINIPFLYRKKELTEDYSYEVSTVKSSKKGKKKVKEKIPFPGIKNSLNFFIDSFKTIFGKIVKSFRVEKFHFKALAASNDAAITAELYGFLCSAGAAIHQFASNAKGMKNANVYVEVIPDFNAQTADIYSELIFSIRIWRLLLIVEKAYHAWSGYKKLSESVFKQKNEETKINNSKQSSPNDLKNN